MDLRVRDGTIEDVRFTGIGCSISRAAASMLTEEIKGKTLEEVKHIRPTRCWRCSGSSWVPFGSSARSSP